MKVKLFDNVTEAGFTPIEVSVTIETQGEMDALSEHDECMMSTSYSEVDGISQKSGYILRDLTDAIYKEARS